MFSNSLNQSHPHRILEAELMSGHHLFTKQLTDDHFILDTYPSRQMLNQNMGPTARLLVLRRPNHLGDFTLQLDKCFALFIPDHAKVIVRDERMRSFRMVRPNDLLILGPGRYSILGRGRELQDFSCRVVRFTKSDVIHWGEEGYLTGAAQAKRQPFDPVCPAGFMGRPVSPSDPHWTLLHFVILNLCRAPLPDIHDYLRNGPMEGEPLVNEDFPGDKSICFTFPRYAQRVRKRKRITEVSDEDFYLDTLKYLARMNLAELRRHRPPEKNEQALCPW